MDLSENLPAWAVVEDALPTHQRRKAALCALDAMRSELQKNRASGPKKNEEDVEAVRQTLRRRGLPLWKKLMTTDEPLSSAEQDDLVLFLDSFRSDFEGFDEIASQPKKASSSNFSTDAQRNAPHEDDKKETTKQQLFRTCLLDFDALMKELNIVYFLACGTALGLHREGQFIEHDTDIDVGIRFGNRSLYDVQEEVLSLIGAVDFSPFRCIDVLGCVERGFELRLQHRQSGVLLDVNYYYDEVDHNGKKFVWFATYYEGAEKKAFGMHRYLHSCFEPVPFEFAGRTFAVAPVSTLVEQYGDDWMTPKQFTYAEGIRGEYKNIIDE